MIQYLELLEKIITKGTNKPASRENMPGTKSLFGEQMRFNLADGFPILTTKQVSFKNIKTELIWFLRGAGNIKFLFDNVCNIWNEDAYMWYKKQCENSGLYAMSFNSFIQAIKDNAKVIDLHSLHGGYFKSNYKLGDCPLGYELWRNHHGQDQIKNLINSLRNSPQKRNHLLTAYDPSYVDVALDPCHILAQFNCRPLTIEEREEISSDLGFGYPSSKGKEEHFSAYNIPKYYLDCHLYQRSADFCLGVPYNTASYALLTHIFAEIANMIPGDLIHTFGDCHVYDNHVELAKEQLNRTPGILPKLKINPEIMKRNLKVNNISNWIEPFIDSLQIGDFSLENYNPQPSIKYPLSTGLVK